jgi:CHAT domain-containing protein
LAGQLVAGAVRASEEEPKGSPSVKGMALPAMPAGDAPFAHPRYWAAFILIGDPE